ncbi:FG-GAP repeat protein, partial [Candidatus Latescibacterota bacterium]
MKNILRIFLYTILLFTILISTSLGAQETTEYPETIHVQNRYDGLIKIVENYTREKSVIHVISGDLNGDGIDDAIIGSRHSDAHGLEDAGIIYIIFGNLDFFQTNPLDVGASENILRITGNERYDYLGRSIATGDINGDGFDDLLFGANNSLLHGDSYKGNGYI